MLRRIKERHEMKSYGWLQTIANLSQTLAFEKTYSLSYVWKRYCNVIHLSLPKQFLDISLCFSIKTADTHYRYEAISSQRTRSLLRLRKSVL